MEQKEDNASHSKIYEYMKQLQAHENSDEALKGIQNLLKSIEFRNAEIIIYDLVNYHDLRFHFFKDLKYLHESYRHKMDKNEYYQSIQIHIDFFQRMCHGMEINLDVMVILLKFLQESTLKKLRKSIINLMIEIPHIFC